MKNLNSVLKFTKNVVLLQMVAVFAFAGATLPRSGLTSDQPITAEAVFSTPGPDSQRPVINAILSAQHKIQMWMFSMSNPEVISALKTAAGKGVTIEIIFDKGMFKGTNAFVNDLQATRGITINQASKAFSLSHAKTFIVDDSRAYIMTLNLTKNFPVQRDTGVETSDASIVADLQTLFAADLRNSQSGGSETPSLSNSNLVISPTDSTSEILALINSAQQSIELTVENLGQRDVIAALIATHARGVDVKVITPLCDMNPNSGYNVPGLKQLSSAGVQARAMGYPATAAMPYMHQKMIIVDGARFFVGSENFSMNSLSAAREIGVIVKVDETTAVVEQNFATDWAAAQDINNIPPQTKCKAIELAPDSTTQPTADSGSSLSPTTDSSSEAGSSITKKVTPTKKVSAVKKSSSTKSRAKKVSSNLFKNLTAKELHLAS